ARAAVGGSRVGPHGDLYPAGVGAEGRAEVEVDREDPVGDRHAVEALGDDGGAARRGTEQAEAHVVSAADLLRVLAERTLVGEGGADGVGGGRRGEPPQAQAEAEDQSENRAAKMHEGRAVHGGTPGAKAASGAHAPNRGGVDSEFGREFSPPK